MSLFRESRRAISTRWSCSCGTSAVSVNSPNDPLIVPSNAGNLSATSQVRRFVLVDRNSRSAWVVQSLETRVAQLSAGRSLPRLAPRVVRRWDIGAVAVALRWGAMCFAVLTVLSPIGPNAGRDLRRDIVATSVLVVYCVARTVYPIRSAEVRHGSVSRSCCFDAALCTVVVLFTGGWSSPLGPA